MQDLSEELKRELDEIIKKGWVGNVHEPIYIPYREKPALIHIKGVHHE